MNWSIRINRRQAAQKLRSVRDILYHSMTVLRAIPHGLRSAWHPMGSPPQRPRLLFVDEMLPDPRLGAGFPRAAQIIDAIVAAGWDIEHYALSANAAHQAALSPRFDSAVRFRISRGRRGLHRLWREERNRFDAVLISRPSTMLTFLGATRYNKLDRPSPFLIYDAEAIFVERDVARLALTDRPSTDDDIKRALRAEVSITAHADAILTVKEEDADIYRHYSRSPVAVVSHAIEPAPTDAHFADRRTIIIVGKMAGPPQESPNVDSVLWYVEHVAPLLRDRHGIDIPLTIVGHVDDDTLQLLQDAPVTLAGMVDDLDPIYANARIFVAPTRFCAGIPLKVIEAAAAGVPCVVSELIGEQCRFENGVHAAVAGDAAAFAEACANLYRDQKVWTMFRQNALAEVTERFSREKLFASVCKVMTLAGENRTAISSRRGE